jgi:hypothetical protein
MDVQHWYALLLHGCFTIVNSARGSRMSLNPSDDTEILVVPFSTGINPNIEQLRCSVATLPHVLAELHLLRFELMSHCSRISETSGAPSEASMRIQTTIFYALAALVSSTFLPAFADESGLASMHAWQKVGGRTCMTDHEHDGAGNGHTQEAAMRVAIRSWEAFTDLEYGSDWASYANSVGKRATCGRGVMGDVSCQISSRACKGGVLSTKTARPIKRRNDRR